LTHLRVHQLAFLDEEDAVAAVVVNLEPPGLALVAEKLDQFGQRHVAELSGQCHLECSSEVLGLSRGSYLSLKL
jgi:hypothetical protein